MSERFTLRAAVLGLILKDNKVLMLRRANTGWSDGDYDLPSGHVDGSESLRQAVCREVAEETGLIAQPDDVEFVHLFHFISNEEYLNIFFTIRRWQGEPRNNEPQKHDDLHWFALDDLPKNITPTTKQALTSYRSRVFYSEKGF